MKRAFIIGNPVVNSLSPRLHRFWLQQNNIAGDYIAFELELARACEFIRDFYAHDFCGGNVTIPYKQNAFTGCHMTTPQAKRLKAVNTLWFDNGKIWGDNTDVYGFAAGLDNNCPDWSDKYKEAVVLGAGGAARAIVYCLQQRGVDRITIINRNYDNGVRLLADIGVTANIFDFSYLTSDQDKGKALLLVNTLPASLLAASGAIMSGLDNYLGKLAKTSLINDINYSQRGTSLTQMANDKNIRANDGLGMLIHQAVPGFELWFGVRPEVNEDTYNNLRLL